MSFLSFASPRFLFLCVRLSDEISGYHFLTATKDKMEAGYSKARAARGKFPALPRALLCLSISLAPAGRLRICSQTPCSPWASPHSTSHTEHKHHRSRDSVLFPAEHPAPGTSHCPVPNRNSSFAERIHADAFVKTAQSPAGIAPMCQSQVVTAFKKKSLLGSSIANTQVRFSGNKTTTPKHSIL